MEHLCPLVPAASAPPAEAAPVTAAESAPLGRVLAGLGSLGEAPTARLEPSSEDFGVALDAWGSSVDAMRVLPVAGVGVTRGV